MITHSKVIFEDVKEAVHYFKKGEFFEYGTSIGKTLTDAFGQVSEESVKYVKDKLLL